MPHATALPDHVLSIVINVPRQRVWDEITKTGRIQRAMVNTVLESALVPGSKLRYYSPNRKRVFVVGAVVEVSPPARFVHTYVFTFRPEEPSLVTWELEEISGGCRVTFPNPRRSARSSAPAGRRRARAAAEGRRTVGTRRRRHRRRATRTSIEWHSLCGRWRRTTPITHRSGGAHDRSPAVAAPRWRPRALSLS